MLDFSSLDSWNIFQLVTFSFGVVIAICLAAKGKQRISESLGRRKRRKAKVLLWLPNIGSRSFKFVRFLPLPRLVSRCPD